ncbi:transposase protein (plasmid) [Ralstonia solanacearum Po82]|uniref:Transposase protein n=1 Tax=Ralstonia solanacearum (strain Po82) TaxID=1031711 RepID=F6G9U7_RALS8|nr:transposase protein [Ralstonia solanacearum Po82]
MRGARSSRREYLMRGDSDVLALPPGWIPDQWEKSIFPNGKRAGTTGISSCA